MGRMTLNEAVIEAVSTSLRERDDVFLLGEDIGIFGSPMQSTKGLWEEFGSTGRMIDTPISEEAIAGAAVGAAMAGSRPIIDLMFGEFLPLVFTPLAVEGAAAEYRTNGRVTTPMVVRAKYGVGPHRGHPESYMGSWMGFPGLKVVAPSTPQDAYSMMLSAVADDGIVLFMEHMSLLHGPRGHVDKETQVPLGKAQVRRPGTDVSIITYGLMVQRAERAAKALASDGIECEVVDLRTLNPLDVGTLVDSAERTRRVLLVEESWPVAGPASEVCARIVREATGHIEFGFALPPHTPIPFALELETMFVPSVDKIADAALALCRKTKTGHEH